MKDLAGGRGRLSRGDLLLVLVLASMKDLAGGRGRDGEPAEVGAADLPASMKVLAGGRGRKTSGWVTETAGLPQ